MFARYALIVLFLTLPITLAAQPLPSWNEGKSRTAIMDFVELVTDEGGPGFVPTAERIAVFDNDGTLWAEKPAYTQLLFAVDRVKAMAPSHPEWKGEQPFKGILENDLEAALAGGEEALMKIIMATHAGMTTGEFEAEAADWFETARHPETGKAYTEMVYQPMLEVMEYLRANGFKTFIVSGGGVELMRVFAEEVYGVPPEQVVGSSIKAEFEMRNNEPVIVKQPELNFINDKAGKPVAINHHIGRRPIAAFGNSDGDLQMLQWTTAGDGPRLGVIVHHTDAEREWAYDRKSHVGKLDQALNEAPDREWVVVDMKAEWNVIYPDKGQ
ncbi:HAD family hydrolase [Marinobacter segnicrescens]|uniref:HAD family hydrolase n=1 Tax=Marinobacter segnicrescens TaxID=430453 RepID=UPI003A8DFE8F